MKYIKDYKNYFILLLILVLSNNLLKSQTFLPPQQMFTVNGIDKYLSSNDSIFKFENKMKFGFHWGGEKKISDALGINFIEINSILSENFLRHQRASNTDAYLTNSNLRGFSEAMSMEWKANLLIDTTKLDELQTREYDLTKPVFGFSKIKGNITNITSSDNRFGDYNYLNLDTCHIGDTVLQGNTYNNKLTSYGDTTKIWNGKNWYLTVNLKKDANYTYSQNNDTLFRVWIGVFYTEDNAVKLAKIRFDSIPKLSAGSYEFENISNYNKTARAVYGSIRIAIYGIF